MKLPPAFLLDYFLFACCMYALVLKMTNGNRPSALLAAIALILQPQIVSFAVYGHGSKLATAALIPIIYLLLDETLKKPKFDNFIFLSMAVGFQFLRAHTQIAYYTWMMMGLMIGFWLFVSHERIKDE